MLNLMFASFLAYFAKFLLSVMRLFTTIFVSGTAMIITVAVFMDLIMVRENAEG